MKKKPTKKLPVFKHIVKRLQKRKDKKKVYYYYNKTDKRTASKDTYNDSLKIREVYKEKYGKDWLKKFYSGVTQIKKVEQGEKKHTLKQIEKIVKEYQRKTGFPMRFTNPINFSINAEVTDTVLSQKNFVIEYNNRFYLLPPDRLIDLTTFVFYVVDTFFSYLRNHYKSETINKKTKKGLSPFILWQIDYLINNEYPELFSMNLDASQSSEGFISAMTAFKNFVRQGFNEYLFDLQVVNVYELIYNSK